MSIPNTSRPDTPDHQFERIRNNVGVADLSVHFSAEMGRGTHIVLPPRDIS